MYLQDHDEHQSQKSQFHHHKHHHGDINDHRDADCSNNVNNKLLHTIVAVDELFNGDHLYCGMDLSLDKHLFGVIISIIMVAIIIMNNTSSINDKIINNAPSLASAMIVEPSGTSLSRGYIMALFSTPTNHMKRSVRTIW